MSTPGKYDDVFKAAKDLVEKGHVFDAKNSLKCKASNGAVFSAESKNGKAAGSTDSKIGLKFSPYIGYNVSKLEYNNVGRIETEVDTTVEGAKFVGGYKCGAIPTGKENPNEGSLSVEYGGNVEGVGYFVTAGVKFAEKDKSFSPNASALASYDGFLLGGSAKLAAGSAALDSWTAAVGYATGDSKFVAHSEKLKNFTFSYHTKAADNLTLAAVAVHTLAAEKKEDNKEPTVSLASVWNVDSDSKIQTGIDQNALVKASYITNLRKGVELTFSAEYCLKTHNLGRTGAGLNFSF